MSFLSSLAGTYTGEGIGIYPTIKSFKYNEGVILQQIPGKPVLTYSQRTSHPETGAPMHAENGFIKFTPRGSDSNSNVFDVNWNIAQNTGLAELSTGTYDVSKRQIHVRKHSLGRPSNAKPPAVTDIERVYTFTEDGQLEYQMLMATDKTEHQLHLKASLKRS